MKTNPFDLTTEEQTRLVGGYTDKATEAEEITSKLIQLANEHQNRGRMILEAMVATWIIKEGTAPVICHAKGIGMETYQTFDQDINKPRCHYVKNYMWLESEGELVPPELQTRAKENPGLDLMDKLLASLKLRIQDVLIQQVHLSNKETPHQRLRWTVPTRK